ncbi:MAG: hypothetical protein RL748_4059, partial [Pseudomonadota bacterium]
MPSVMSRLQEPFNLLGLALLYVLLGRLALLLAIPPGYAMAIYPPAGLALGALLVGGYRYAGAVLLGSFLLNSWIGYENSGSVNTTALLLALSIACGAAVQAASGRALLQRWVGFPLTLDTNKKIFRFIVLGAVLSCCINASIGIGALLGFGFLPASQAAGNWFTWWVGDALGVMIITPLCLILRGQPASLWRSRASNVMLPLLLTLVGVVTVFLYVRQWEQNKFQLEFRETAQRIGSTLQIRLDAHVEVQRSVVSLFSAVDTINEREFADFVAQSVASNGALQAIEWAPRVKDPQRASFETRHRNNNPLFAIQERQGNKLVSASMRDEYYPVLYAAPALGNERALGFDLASERVRYRAMSDARDLGLPVASEPVVLVQSAAGGNVQLMGSILFSALYDKKSNAHDKDSRRQANTGMVVSVLRIGDVISTLLTPDDKQNILFRLSDSNLNPGAAAYFDSYAGAVRSASPSPLFSSNITFGGRELLLVADPAEGYLNAHKSWAAWGAMVGGMLFAGLVCMYLLYVSGRAFMVEALVDQRTHELYDSEHRLHAILDNAAEGIMTFDGDGRVTLSNRAAHHLLGHDDASRQHIDPSLGGRLFSDLFHQSGQQANLQLAQLLTEADSTGQSHVFREVLARRPDGTSLEVGLALAKLLNREQVMVIVIIHDLTEQKRVERLKGEFVSAVSHELRTPLTSIRGSLGLLVGGVGGTIPESAKKLIKLANDNAERLSVLINDLLDFERLEYGGMLFFAEAQSASELVKKAIDMNQGYAQKFHIQLML